MHHRPTIVVAKYRNDFIKRIRKANFLAREFKHEIQSRGQTAGVVGFQSASIHQSSTLPVFFPPLPSLVFYNCLPLFDHSFSSIFSFLLASLSMVLAIFTISAVPFVTLHLLIFMRKCIMQTRRRSLRWTCPWQLSIRYRRNIDEGENKSEFSWKKGGRKLYYNYSEAREITLEGFVYALE